MKQSDPDDRCPWCLGFPEYVRYHDREWGFPSRDPLHLFEMLNLEGAQAGLSWATILKKREGYRRAFADFDPERVARYTPSDVEHLMRDRGIVRNRRKIEATIGNARAWLLLQEEVGDVVDYLWSFVGGSQRTNQFRTLAEVPATSPASEALSRDLKRKGFRFVGPTICYSFMQAVGMVNDHLVSCPLHARLRDGKAGRAGLEGTYQRANGDQEDQ